MSEKIEQNNMNMPVSSGAETLAPNSNPADDEKTRIEYLYKMIDMLGVMDKEDLSYLLQQALDLIGKEADSLPVNANADMNRATIAAKNIKESSHENDEDNEDDQKSKDDNEDNDNDVKENTDVSNEDEVDDEKKDKEENDENIDSDELLKKMIDKIDVSDDIKDLMVKEGFSKEFINKACVLFEAALNARTKVINYTLKEYYKQKLKKQTKIIENRIVKKLDKYLSYLSEQWLADNAVAIEKSLRTELTEDFINNLYKLFKEHYISIPEEKIDVVEQLAQKINQLEGQLNEAINNNQRLKEKLLLHEKRKVIENATMGLSLSQKNKFLELAENLNFDGDIKKYREKLSIIKEQYFNTKTKKNNILEETYEGEDTAVNKNIDPMIFRYSEAISKIAKK
jgi:hypothetical protein